MLGETFDEIATLHLCRPSVRPCLTQKHEAKCIASNRTGAVAVFRMGFGYLPHDACPLTKGWFGSLGRDRSYVNSMEPEFRDCKLGRARSAGMRVLLLRQLRRNSLAGQSDHFEAVLVSHFFDARMTPGFIRLHGSMQFLILAMSLRSALVRLAGSQLTFTRPIPCSAVTAPQYRCTSS